jgi:hypothetical protein
METERYQWTHKWFSEHLYVALDKKHSTGPIRPAQVIHLQAGGLVRVLRVSRVHWSGFFWFKLGGFGWMKSNHRNPYPTDPIYLYYFFIIIS